MKKAKLEEILANIPEGAAIIVRKDISPYGVFCAIENKPADKPAELDGIINEYSKSVMDEARVTISAAAATDPDADKYGLYLYCSQYYEDEKGEPAATIAVIAYAPDRKTLPLLQHFGAEDGIVDIVSDGKHDYWVSDEAWSTSGGLNPLASSIYPQPIVGGTLVASTDGEGNTKGLSLDDIAELVHKACEEIASVSVNFIFISGLSPEQKILIPRLLTGFNNVPDGKIAKFYKDYADKAVAKNIAEAL